MDKKLVRPICPNCGRELVFIAIVTGRNVWNTWQCDCLGQPDGVASKIVRAREWDKQALVYEVGCVQWS